MYFSFVVAKTLLELLLQDIVIAPWQLWTLDPLSHDTDLKVREGWTEEVMFARPCHCCLFFRVMGDRFPIRSTVQCTICATLLERQSSVMTDRPVSVTLIVVSPVHSGRLWLVPSLLMC